MNKLKIDKDKVIRTVDDIEISKKILYLLNENPYFDGKIVKTTICEEYENALEHELLTPILHSEEYTVSMAYDVTKLGIEMALEAEKSKIYSFDLLPHNFTFLYGNWILYDFGAFEETPKDAKTQVRGDFQIPFATFEMLNLLDRKLLGKCFLNRFSVGFMYKILTFYRFLPYFLKLLFGKILLFFRRYKEAYKWLLVVHNCYSQKISRNFYAPKNIDFPQFIDEFLAAKNIKTLFSLGNSSCEFALKYNNIKTFVYLEDYDICDEFYNYIVLNKINHIGTGVLYPLVDEDIISKNYPYKAIYDTYAQERFLADCVFACDVENLSCNVDLDIFIENITNFTRNAIILELLKPNSEVEYTLKKIFLNVKTYEFNGKYYILADERILNIALKSPNKPYKNNNRGYEKKQQSEHVLKLIKG